MITETEAKKKWCPFVGAHGDPQHGGGINRNPDRQRDFNCIASECMAWRWGARLTDEQIETNFEAVACGEKEPYPRFGYCGLAGKEQ